MHSMSTLLDAVQKRFLNLTRYLLARLRWYTQYRNKRAPDGLPFPPPQLSVLVTGFYDLEYFYQNGFLGAESIRSVLTKNGLDINAFGSILDFGCGCGRIMRHWKALTGPKLYGTDYNQHLIEWCQEALPFAEFSTNGLASRLNYEDNQFDFVYAISVFTHLNEDLQHFWIRELTRVLKPGGFLLITVHGRGRFFQLTPEQIQIFESGRLVVRREDKAGTNLCSSYHPEQYVRQSLAKGLTIMDFVPDGAKDGTQDMHLLQKPIPSE